MVYLLFQSVYIKFVYCIDLKPSQIPEELCLCDFLVINDVIMYRARPFSVSFVAILSTLYIVLHYNHYPNYDVCRYGCGLYSTYLISILQFYVLILLPLCVINPYLALISNEINPAEDICTPSYCHTTLNICLSYIGLLHEVEFSLALR